jgi:hypothetical protein
MRDEFIIERQGRKMVLYAGLLDEAHQRGLRSIETDLLQSPSAENGQTAIVKATVHMFPTVEAQNGPDGQTFTGIGDASPDNVGRNIAAHTIRMAETRAKARALRDAINVGMTALEETGDDEPQRAASNGAGGSNVREMPRRAQGQPKQRGEASGGKPMSEAQERYIRKLCEDSGHDMPDTDGFTARDASELIARLKEAAR